MEAAYLKLSTRGDDLSKVNVLQYASDECTDCVLVTILINDRVYSLDPIKDKKKVTDLLFGKKIICFPLLFTQCILSKIFIDRYEYDLKTFKCYDVTKDYLTQYEVISNRISLKQLCWCCGIEVKKDVEGYNAMLEVARSEIDSDDFNNKEMKKLIKYQDRNVRLIKSVHESIDNYSIRLLAMID